MTFFPRNSTGQQAVGFVVEFLFKFECLANEALPWRNPKIKRHIIFLAALSVGLVAAFLPQVQAGQPGGQTVGGHERQVVAGTGTVRNHWTCNGCVLPICATVATEDLAGPRRLVARSGR